MRRAAALLLMLYAPLGSAFAAEDVFENRVVNGHKFELLQVGQGDYRARVDGKQIFGTESEKAEVALVGVYASAGKAFVLLAVSSTRCENKLIAIDLSQSAPLVSKPLGACSTRFFAAIVDGALAITYRTASGGTAVDRFPTSSQPQNSSAATALALDLGPLPDVVPAAVIRFRHSESDGARGVMVLYGSSGMAHYQSLENGQIRQLTFDGKQVAASIQLLDGPDNGGTIVYSGDFVGNHVTGTYRVPANAGDLTGAWQGDTTAFTPYRNWRGVIESQWALNLTETLYFLYQSSSQKDPRSFALLGVLFGYGIGVPKDVDKAAAFWREGVELGSSDAANFLGKAYEDGRGVRKDPAVARALYAKAGNDRFVIPEYSFNAEGMVAIIGYWMLPSVSAEFECLRSAPCVAEREEQLQQRELERRERLEMERLNR